MSVEITHHFGGGVYSKETLIPAGMSLAQHVHKHDHLSILARGDCWVQVDGKETYYHAPACITIVAGKSHKVTAITQVVWFCIHATDETDPAKVDHTLIEGG